jgi:hypothetical protein
MEPIESKTFMKMKKFIGDIEVKKMEDLFTTSQSGIFIVVGWFVSIVEGVDMWFPRIAVSSVPRYNFLVNLFCVLNYLLIGLHMLIVKTK